MHEEGKGSVGSSTMENIIHIAPDIGYLFSRTAIVLCGRTAGDVFDAGEFIELEGNLNSSCTPCPECVKAKRKRTVT